MASSATFTPLVLTPTQSTESSRVWQVESPEFKHTVTYALTQEACDLVCARNHQDVVGLRVEEAEGTSCLIVLSWSHESLLTRTGRSHPLVADLLHEDGVLKVGTGILGACARLFRHLHVPVRNAAEVSDLAWFLAPQHLTRNFPLPPSIGPIENLCALFTSLRLPQSPAVNELFSEDLSDRLIIQATIGGLAPVHVYHALMARQVPGTAPCPSFDYSEPPHECLLNYRDQILDGIRNSDSQLAKVNAAYKLNRQWLEVTSRHRDEVASDNIVLQERIAGLQRRVSELVDQLEKDSALLAYVRQTMSALSDDLTAKTAAAKSGRTCSL
ncbi:hypothetical protein HWV62_39792 [Athelia sp. TMB]|nr:hypothetical protein HWV62_39792 [Athelia sp. TMB]